jgi:hypothetical protein
VVGAALFGAGLAPLAASAVVNGQIDTFEIGTPQGWVAGAGHPAPPQNIATGGPGGAGDNYLQVVSQGGFGAGSRFAAFNTAQWSGNYLSAGVGSILVNVNNLGSTDLALRLLFTDGSGQFGSHVALSTDAVLLPAGSGWTTVLFPITPSDLTAQTGDVSQALSNAAQLWIFHNEASSFPPPATVSLLGVDNVEALPEPTLQGALGAGLVALACLDRRRARRAP